MHIYFAGIGGAGIGPLALIAKDLGHTVSGSDASEPPYLDALNKAGIDVSLDQSGKELAELHANNPVDWFVYSSALPLNNPNHPLLNTAKELGLKSSKRDELLSFLIKDNNIKLLAIAGTHGKSTTTAMAIWLMDQLGESFGYSVGAKLPFGPMGSKANPGEWFIYECDEFDRNFLSFEPDISLISGLGYDHHEIFLTEQDYNDAFMDFCRQSQQVVIWPEDQARLLGVSSVPENFLNPNLTDKIQLPGLVNKLDAELAVAGVSMITGVRADRLYEIINDFPGVSRRFEKLSENIYTDYAHTPEKITGAIDIAKSLNQPIAVVYEPLTNRRQHYIKDAYKDLFADVAKIYWVPSYLAREDDNLEVLSPEDLIAELSNQDIAVASELTPELAAELYALAASGTTVLLLSGGGANSLDSWARVQFDS